MKTELKDKLEKILSNHFLVDARKLKGSRYLEDLGITLTEKKELLNLFEDEFQIQLNERDERNIRTVRDTVNILNQYLHPNATITQKSSLCI
jgi:acyl carrier protein